MTRETQLLKFLSMTALNTLKSDQYRPQRIILLWLLFCEMFLLLLLVKKCDWNQSVCPPWVFLSLSTPLTPFSRPPVSPATIHVSFYHRSSSLCPKPFFSSSGWVGRLVLSQAVASSFHQAKGRSRKGSCMEHSVHIRVACLSCLTIA